MWLVEERGFLLWERSLQSLIPGLVLGTVKAETEHAQGVSVVGTQLKCLISRMRAWSGQEFGKGS